MIFFCITVDGHPVRFGLIQPKQQRQPVQQQQRHKRRLELYRPFSSRMEYIIGTGQYPLRPWELQLEKVETIHNRSVNERSRRRNKSYMI